MHLKTYNDTLIKYVIRKQNHKFVVNTKLKYSKCNLLIININTTLNHNFMVYCFKQIAKYSLKQYILKISLLVFEITSTW